MLYVNILYKKLAIIELLAKLDDFYKLKYG